MDRIATLTKLWPFARPTLIRWIIGAMLWLAAHYGITGLASPAAAVWANTTLDRAAPYLIVAISSVWNWFEKKALAARMPNTVIESLAKQAIEPDPGKPEASVTVTMDDLTPKDVAAVNKQIEKGTP